MIRFLRVQQVQLIKNTSSRNQKMEKETQMITEIVEVDLSNHFYWAWDGVFNGAFVRPNKLQKSFNIYQ